MISEAASIGSDSNVTVALAVLVGTMIVALVRLLSKAEHNQDAHKNAIEELKTCQEKQQQTIDSHTLKIDRLERIPAPDCHAARTGRFSVVEERDR